jgi:hypothetical protein
VLNYGGILACLEANTGWAALTIALLGPEKMMHSCQRHGHSLSGERVDMAPG